MTVRGNHWRLFANKVLEHIETYTVPQYGDAPNDLVEQFDVNYCVQQVMRYAARWNSNARGAGEQFRDLVKIAHYAQLAYQKLLDKEINHGAVQNTTSEEHLPGSVRQG